MAEKPMWEFYDVVWNFTGRLCGSVPLNRELIAAWLAARAPKKVPAAVAAGAAPSLADLAEEVESTLASEELEERVTLGFQQDELDHLFMRAATVRAHLKDCALQTMRFIGVQAFKSKVSNHVYIEPERLSLFKGGDPVESHDGEFERAVHVMTAAGPRNALKRIRYVERPTLVFTLRVLNDGVITEGHLRSIMDYGGVHGYAGERSMGEGRYAYTLERREGN